MAQKKATYFENELFSTKNPWHGITHENHLTAVGAYDPYVISKKIQQIMDVNLEMDMISFVEKFGTYTVKAPRFQWHIEGCEVKNYPLRGAWEDYNGTISIGTNNLKPGANRTKFYLDFDEKVFSVTEVITGHKPDKYKILIKDDPRYIGNVWRFECEIVSSSPDEFIPISELKLGNRFSSEYGLVPRTMSSKGMDIGFKSPGMLEAEVSQFRVQHTVPGNMVNKGKVRPLKFYFKDTDGKERMSWISNVEWELLQKVRKAKAYTVKYGKSNRWEDGTYGNYDQNGFAIEAGSGWKEQWAASNRHSFALTPDIDDMINFALDATVGKTDVGSRVFTVMAGEWGLKAMAESIENKLSSVRYENAAWLKDHMGRAFSWSGNNVHVNLGEFNKVVTVRGITFIMMLDPAKDDPNRNKLRHPNGGLVSSYEYDIVGFGSKEENQNMQIVRVEGEDPIYAVQAGMRSPWGDKKATSLASPKHISTPIDASTIHIMETIGGIVHDPTKVIQYYPEMSL